MASAFRSLSAKQIPRWPPWARPAGAVSRTWTACASPPTVNMPRPLAQREAGLAKRINDDGGRLMTTMEKFLDTAEDGIRANDPTLSQFILSRTMAWDVRSYVGTINGILNGVVGAERAFKPEEDRTVTTSTAVSRRMEAGARGWPTMKRHRPN